MPPQQQQQETNPLNAEQFQQVALNVVELFTAAFSTPLDYMLRRKLGSRYCNPTVIFLTWIIMFFVPLFDAATAAVSPIFLAAHIQRPPQGLFSIADYSKLFAILSIIHGIRTWRRMFNLTSEDHSRFEGPPWFFFELLPRGRNFCFTRIVWEPAAVLIVSMVLHSLFIFQDGLAHFLEFSALCLAMRQFISWYRGWMFLRDVLDASNDAPIIAKFVENNASQDELNAVHLSGLPGDLSPELRRSMAMNIARVMAPTTTIPENKGVSHENL